MREKAVENALIVAVLWACGIVSCASSSMTSATERYCPALCACHGPTTVSCKNLTAVHVTALLYDNAFVSAFSATLRNFSLKYSELYDFTPAATLLKRFPQLLFLDLSHNTINATTATTGSSTISTVVVLDISYNRLAAIGRDAFVPLFANAEEIRVEYNGIFSIQWEAFRLFKLRRLYLAHNHLATINEHMLRFTPNLELLDLSYNQLALAQSSSFFAAQRLSHIDLSHNRIQRFRYDSFAPLFQLEWFNLAFNNITQIPADLRQFIALRVLNISGNPLQRISVGELDQPVLQVLDVSNCPYLRLVEAGAFAKLPNLQTALLANNSALSFISPQAFRSVKMLYELDLSHDALTTLNESIVQLPTRILLAENPFDCACMAPLVRRHALHVVDANDITCLPAGKSTAPIKISNVAIEEDACIGSPLILPFGDELSAQVGDFFSLYCASRNANNSIEWTLPNGTQLLASSFETTAISTSQQNRDFYGPLFDDKRPFSMSAAAHFPHLHTTHTVANREGERRHARIHGVPILQQQPVQQVARRRIVVTREQMRFEVLTAEDSGDYRCRILPVTGSVNESKGTPSDASRVLRLRVERPRIGLVVVEMGSHYASLMWNASLRVRATDKVALSLDVRDAATGQLSRSIQLSLFNPWYSYNVMRLKPLNNYTFCLAYRLLDYDDASMISEKADRPASGFATMFGASSTASVIGGLSAIGSALREARDRGPLFETCVNAQTLENLSFWRSLNASTIATLAAILFVFVALMIVRAVYLRFYIWQEAKLRARMNESLSGQSFLSNSSSANPGGFSRSTTFENTPQVQGLMNGCIDDLSSARKLAPSARRSGGFSFESARMLKFDNVAV